MIQHGFDDKIHGALQVSYRDLSKHKKNQVTILNAGCPVNFTGEVNSTPPELIQFSLGIKLESIKEVMAAKPKQGVLKLSKAGNHRSIHAMDEALPGWRNEAPKIVPSEKSYQKLYIDEA